MKIDITIRDCTPYEATKIIAFTHTLPLSAEPVAVEVDDAPKKEPMKYKKNPYGIPHELYTTDKKKYNRLYYRCQTKGITYKEALKQETDEQKARTAKPVPNPAPKPITNDVIKSTNLVIAPTEEIKPPAISAPLKIAPGVLVKQVRPDHGKQLQGVGTVVTVERGGQIIGVRDFLGDIYKIDVRCLEVYVQPNGRSAE